MSAANGAPYVPTLETERLVVRPLVETDLAAVHQLYLDIDWVDASLPEAELYDRRASWLAWTTSGYREFERLYQPPLGDRAGGAQGGRRPGRAGGPGPVLAPFGQLPSFGGAAKALRTMEMGLFWAISPSAQGRGYATEAAGALVDWAFDGLLLDRLVATTEHDNTTSIAVMRRLGMRIEINPQPDPPWLQTVGVLRATDRRPPISAES